MSRSRFTASEKLALLESYQQSGMSRRGFAKEHGIVPRTLKRWTNLYERDGLSGLEEVQQNQHYSKQFKLSVIQAYLAGEGTTDELTTKFGLRNDGLLHYWLLKYNEDKTVAASPSRKQVLLMSRKTTFEERIEIVEYVTKDDHSYTQAAEHFHVSYQQARSWVIKAQKGGYEALVDNRGHHKDQAELTETDKLKLRVRQLESQLKDQALVAAYVKKLQELQHKG